MSLLFFADYCRRTGLVVLLLAGLALSACSSTGPAAPAASDVPSLLDSLRAENTRLRDEKTTLQDSVAFYDDVDSGKVYRELRALQDQVARMAFELDALRDGGQTVQVLPVGRLFEPATATLSDAGLEALKPIAAQLRQTYPKRTVWVEGHSDNTPIGESLQEQFPSNWELSAARATAVVRTLIALSGLDKSQFTAVGYGNSRPRASNETESGRQRNRRVRIAVLPSPRDYSRPFETSW